jgi:hypothetical protein
MVYFDDYLVLKTRADATGAFTDYLVVSVGKEGSYTVKAQD